MSLGHGDGKHEGKEEQKEKDSLGKRCLKGLAGVVNSTFFSSVVAASSATDPKPPTPPPSPSDLTVFLSKNHYDGIFMAICGSNPEPISGLSVITESPISAAGLYNPVGREPALPTVDCKLETASVARGIATTYTCSIPTFLRTNCSSPSTAGANVTPADASKVVYDVAIQQEKGGEFRSLPLKGNATSPDLPGGGVGSSLSSSSSSSKDNINKWVDEHAGRWDGVKTTAVTGFVGGVVPVVVEAIAGRCVPKRMYAKLAEKIEEKALKKWTEEKLLPSAEERQQIKDSAEVVAKTIKVQGIREGVTFGFNAGWSFVSPAISGAKEVVTGKWLGVGFKVGAGAFAYVSSRFASSSPSVSMACDVLSVGCRVGSVAVPAYVNPVGTAISAVSGVAGNFFARGVVFCLGAKSKTTPAPLLPPSIASPLLGVVSEGGAGTPAPRLRK